MDLVSTVSKISQENIEAVEKVISKLSETQLKWRPNPGIWSISDVLAHLNTYTRYYHPVFQRKIESTRFRSPNEEFMSSPLGRSAWKSMKLGNAKNIKRKFRARKGYNPLFDKDLHRQDDMSFFKDSQSELVSIAESALTVNMRKVKIPISISKIVRLRLGDALLFIAYHNQRHMQQILNLKRHPNFPKK